MSMMLPEFQGSQDPFDIQHRDAGQQLDRLQFANPN
jgi:hypothetical protein